VPQHQAQQALEIMKNSKYGESSAIIGTVQNGSGVTMRTRLGGTVRVNVLIGEGLPRIC
jgi:hydrogenase expression/formation protein HypE